MSAKIIRFSLTFALVLVVVFNSFVSPTRASTFMGEELLPVTSYELPLPIPNGELSHDVLKGFVSGLSASIGGVAGTLVACYSVDVLITPVNPLAAAYLATLCPGIGATLGGAGGFATVKAVVNPI